MNNESNIYYEALELFQRLWYRAWLQELFAILRGKSARLCSFAGIRRDLKLQTSTPRGLQEVPLNQIIGSVGRSQDFIRRFLPRRHELRDRWAGVYMRVTGASGLPPVKLYQVCDAYFVIDGNHRVSVAHYLKSQTIEAEVIAFSSAACVPAACR